MSPMRLLRSSWRLARSRACCTGSAACGSALSPRGVWAICWARLRSCWAACWPACCAFGIAPACACLAACCADCAALSADCAGGDLAPCSWPTFFASSPACLAISCCCLAISAGLVLALRVRLGRLAHRLGHLVAQVALLLGELAGLLGLLLVRQPLRPAPAAARPGAAPVAFSGTCWATRSSAAAASRCFCCAWAASFFWAASFAWFMASWACSSAFCALLAGSCDACSFNFCCSLAICSIAFCSACLPASPGFFAASSLGLLRRLGQVALLLGQFLGGLARGVGVGLRRSPRFGPSVRRRGPGRRPPPSACPRPGWHSLLFAASLAWFIASRACSTGFFAVSSAGSLRRLLVQLLLLFSDLFHRLLHRLLAGLARLLPAASSRACCVVFARSRCSFASSFAASAPAFAACSFAACSLAISLANFSAASAARSAAPSRRPASWPSPGPSSRRPSALAASLCASAAAFGSSRSSWRATSACWSAAFFAASGACSLRGLGLRGLVGQVALLLGHLGGLVGGVLAAASLSARSRRASAASRVRLGLVLGLPRLLSLGDGLVRLLLLGLRLLAAADLLGLVGDAAAGPAAPRRSAAGSGSPWPGAPPRRRPRPACSARRSARAASDSLPFICLASSLQRLRPTSPSAFACRRRPASAWPARPPSSPPRRPRPCAAAPPGLAGLGASLAICCCFCCNSCSFCGVVFGSAAACFASSARSRCCLARSRAFSSAGFWPFSACCSRSSSRVASCCDARTSCGRASIRSARARFSASCALLLPGLLVRARPSCPAPRRRRPACGPRRSACCASSSLRLRRIRVLLLRLLGGLLGRAGDLVLLAAQLGDLAGGLLLALGQRRQLVGQPVRAPASPAPSAPAPARCRASSAPRRPWRRAPRPACGPACGAWFCGGTDSCSAARSIAFCSACSGCIRSASGCLVALLLRLVGHPLFETLLQPGQLAGRLARVLRQVDGAVEVVGHAVQFAGRLVLVPQRVGDVVLLQRLGGLLGVVRLERVGLRGLRRGASSPWPAPSPCRPTPAASSPARRTSRCPASSPSPSAPSSSRRCASASSFALSASCLACSARAWSSAFFSASLCSLRRCTSLATSCCSRLTCSSSFFADGSRTGSFAASSSARSARSFWRSAAISSLFWSSCFCAAGR